MENDKSFELMKKIYSELQDIKKSVICNTEKVDKIILSIEQNHGQKAGSII